jgi:GntR family transcriptional regulator
MESVLPIYYQIKQTIRSWIVNKEYTPGEKIPSETEMITRFKVSRLTIRRAISQLVQEGFLISKRGEGTYVSQNEKLIQGFNAELTGVIDDIFTQKSNWETRSVQMMRMKAPKLVREKLALEQEGEEVVQVKRVRFLRDNPYAYAINYLPLAIGEKIVERDLYKKPLIQVLVQDLGVVFTDAIQTMEASFADYEVATALAMASGSPTLFIERILYTKKDRPVDVFQCSYRGDLCKYIVRFKNNKNKWVQQLDSPYSESLRGKDGLS